MMMTRGVLGGVSDGRQKRGIENILIPERVPVAAPGASKIRDGPVIMLRLVEISNVDRVVDSRLSAVLESDRRIVVKVKLSCALTTAKEEGIGANF